MWTLHTPPTVKSSAKHNIPRGYNKNYIPGWDEECSCLLRQHQQASSRDEMDATATTLLHKLDHTRRTRAASADANLTVAELCAAINKLKPGKSPASRNIICITCRNIWADINTWADTNQADFDFGIGK
ncbi:unnamed protein product [Merluccius merluccius]